MLLIVVYVFFIKWYLIPSMIILVIITGLIRKHVFKQDIWFTDYLKMGVVLFLIVFALVCFLVFHIPFEPSSSTHHQSNTYVHG